MHPIEIEGVSKTYVSGFWRRARLEALVDISFQVEAGTIFSLLGPNGAGKTTLVKILLSVVRPSAGAARINGVPCSSVDARAKSGYLPENHRYPNFLNGLETLIFFGRLNGLPASMLRDRANQLLGLVGLDEWKKMKIRKYSKGMLQRLGLAQALLNEPNVLFLDEPTDGVDPVGRKEIRDLLVNLKSQGKTIFLNSHLLSEVERISDRVAILNKGRIIRTGSIPDLTAGALIYEIDLEGGISAELMDRIRRTVETAMISNKTLTVGLHARSELDSVVDLLRTNGFSIGGIREQKLSLEESFMQLIGKQP